MYPLHVFVMRGGSKLAAFANFELVLLVQWVKASISVFVVFLSEKGCARFAVVCWFVNLLRFSLALYAVVAWNSRCRLGWL